MSTILPLDKMTIEQKLQALEELTIDLHRHRALVPTRESGYFNFDDELGDLANRTTPSKP